MGVLRLLPALFAFGLLQVTLRFKDDAELAQKLRARDPHAMADLYDRYGKLTFALIFRIVRNTAVAEDLVQETFLRVWNRIHSFEPGKGSLGPWVLTVARNRAIDYLRSIDGRMAQSALEIDRVENPAMFSVMEDRALTIDRAQRLKGAFEKLPANQKLVIELAYYEGLSQTEMAERMKQPLGTVKTWVRSALKTLRQEL